MKRVDPGSWVRTVLFALSLAWVASGLEAQNEPAPQRTEMTELWSTEVSFDWLRQFEFDAGGARILIVNETVISVDAADGSKTWLANNDKGEMWSVSDGADRVVQLIADGGSSDDPRHRLDVLNLADGGTELSSPGLDVSGFPELWANRDATAIVIEPAKFGPTDDRPLLITQNAPSGVQINLDPDRYDGPIYVTSEGTATFVERGVLAHIAPDGQRIASIASKSLTNTISSGALAGALSADETRLTLQGVDPESYDSTLQVYDLKIGREDAVYLQPDLPRHLLQSVAYMPDGLRLAYTDYDNENAGPRTIRVFDVSKDTAPVLVASVELDATHARAVLSPDGTQVAVLTSNHDLLMYSLTPQDPADASPEDTPLPELVAGLGGLNTLNDIAVSPDNALLATADYQGQVWLWDIASGRALRSFGTYDRSRLSFGPDGQTLAVLGDDRLFTFDIRTGSVLRSSRASGYPALYFARSGDGLLVCHIRGCDFHPDAQDALWTQLDVPDELNGAVICGDQLVLYDNRREGSAALYHVGWNGANVNGARHEAVLPDSEITSVACSSSGSVYLGTEGGDVLHLGLDGQRLASTSIGSKPVRAIALLSDTTLLAASANDDPRRPAQIVALTPDDLATRLVTHVPEPPAGTATYIDFLSLSDDLSRAFTVSQNADPRPSADASKIYISMWDATELGEQIETASTGQTMDPAPFILNKGLAQGGRRPNGVGFSPDGTRLGVTFQTDTVIWSMETGQVERQVTHALGSGPRFSETGLFVPEQGTLRFLGWDRSEEALSVEGIESYASWGGHLSVAGDTVARAVGEDTAIWRDANADGQSFLLPAPDTFFMNWRTLSPSGETLLVQTRDAVLAQSTDPGIDASQATLWSVSEPADGRWRFALTALPAFSADGTQIILPLSEYPSDLGFLALDPETGAVVGEVARGQLNFGPRSVGIRVAQSGTMPEQLAILQTDGTGFADLHLSIGGPSAGRLSMLGVTVTSGTLSADGQVLVLLGLNEEVLVWNRQTGVSQLLDARVFPALAPSHAVAISPDGRLIALSETNGSVSLFETETGTRIAQILSFTGGGWAVVGADGRYDASDPGQIDRLSWIVEDDPLYPLPVEAFIQDYFEPRLLGRVLAGEALPDLRQPQDRNRVTPNARVANITASAPREDGVPTVRVEVEIVEGRRNGVSSGLGVVKLFRDGQLVGQAEGAVLDADGQATIAFDGIALASSDEVSFSTYAFNDDSIKGRTREVRYAPDAGTVGQLKPRAFVVAVGVNAYDNPAWNLSYAATDAEATAEMLTQSLKRSSAFDEVLDVSLTSWAEDGRPRNATLPMITAVLRQLAGTATQRDLAIPGVPILPQARPQDLVYLAFAGHGLAGDDGRFHFFTQEFGAGLTTRQVPEDLSGHSLDSDLLSRLMRDIDAQDIVLVIDACNAAASVEGDGFKPGPMGSKGLGQLAYDKAMRVLVASQAEAVALESDALRHGALTYALLREGLEARHADNEPQDGQINLGEFLSFGRDRVPDLYRGLRSGDFEPMDRGAFSLDVDEEIELAEVQQPTLFDFSRSERGDIVIGDLP